MVEALSGQLRVSGHTDSVDKDAYNQNCRKMRSPGHEHLTGAGVPRSNFVSVTGAGESQPVADNKTAEGRALNRCTEIQINR
ncbi:OmpA family protein [Pseudomonas sp. HN11]|nr:OmpA family protein [Pseudomonas sp. HN11]UII72805.1 OmpA family protein [Pseudomonas sp. HN11]